jgi:hypothetical protein
MQEISSRNSGICKLSWTGTATGLSEWAETVIAQNFCEHVRRAELLPSDGIFYSILDAPCVGSGPAGSSCVKNGTQRLYLIAVRRYSASKVPLKVVATVEATPASALQLDGGKEKDGIHKLEARSFVLPPSYKACLGWKDSIPVQFGRATEAVEAAIAVYLSTKREHQRPFAASVNLSVTVPPLLREETNPAMDLIALAASESIKLLVKEGFDFLKKQLPYFSGDGDLIQLRIDTSHISAKNISDATISPGVEALNKVLSQAQKGELDAYNRKLVHLFNQKNALIGIVDSAVNVIEKSKGDAEIQRLEGEISDAQSHIWRILQSTGLVSVKAADRQTQ